MMKAGEIGHTPPTLWRSTMTMSMTQDLGIAGAARGVAGRSIGTRIVRGTARFAAAVASLFLLFDGGARLAGFAPYVQGTVQAGYGAHLAPWIGLALLVPMVLYLIPRTAVLGAVLVTGYLGGAVATNLRVQGGSLWFLFPVAFGAIIWLDLWLRDARVRRAI
jgi:hypothetical protein